MKTKSILLILLFFVVFVTLAILGVFKFGSFNQANLEDTIKNAIESKLNAKLSEPYFPEATKDIQHDEELIKISTSIIKKHSEGDLSAAFEIIRKYSPVPKVEFDEAKMKFIPQLEMINNRFGGVVGYEFIKSEKIGQSIVRHDCIVKYRIHIIRWEFIYYRPEDKWLLNSFKWDDKIHLIENN